MIIEPQDCVFFFFKQKTAYEIKECGWSSDVCSSDLYAVAALRTRGPREELVRRLGIEPRTYWLRDPNRFGRRGRDLPQFPAFTISKSPGRLPGPTVQPAASVTVHPSPDSVEPLVWNGVVRCKTASLVSTSTPLVAVSVPHAGLARYSMTTMPTSGIGVAPVLF